ncbi:hypothetical protein [Methylobacterium sp. CM6247]
MIKKDELIDAVLDGIIGANDFYEKITKGFSINDSGVEGILQTKIAESIYDSLLKDNEGNLDEEFIVMEYPFKKIFEQSGANKIRGAIPQLVDGAKRVDIVIFDKKERPIIPIEVKRNAATVGFAKDAKRILGVLKRSDTLSSGSVKYGLICGFIFGKGSTREKCLENIKSKKDQCIEYLHDEADIDVVDFFYLDDEPKSFEEPSWWVGGAVCVYLRRSDRNN